MRSGYWWYSLFSLCLLSGWYKALKRTTSKMEGQSLHKCSSLCGWALLLSPWTQSSLEALCEYTWGCTGTERGTSHKGDLGLPLMHYLTTILILLLICLSPLHSSSFFQSVCVLGYCLLPSCLSLILCRLILIAPPNKILFVLRFFVTCIGFVWATFGKLWSITISVFSVRLAISGIFLSSLLLMWNCWLH